jgi:hypothetical protein
LILWRELAWRDMLKVTGIMLTTALAAGTFTNLALQQYGVLVWLSAVIAVGILVVLDVFGRKKAVAVREET